MDAITLLELLKARAEREAKSYGDNEDDLSQLSCSVLYIMANFFEDAARDIRNKQNLK